MEMRRVTTRVLAYTAARQLEVRKTCTLIY
jgi:hypothetical protein